MNQKQHDVNLNVRVPPELLEQLRELARRDFDGQVSMTVSYLLRDAIRQQEAAGAPALLHIPL